MFSPIIARQLHKIYDIGVGVYGWLNGFISEIYPLDPLVFRIRITKSCNFRCSFCFQSESLNKGEKGHLTLDEWKKIIDSLPRHTVLDVTGGEPFLARNFIPLMDYFLSKKHKISVMTNGSIYNEELLQMFVKKKLYYLMFSVEDVGEAHDEIRSQPKSYEKIIKNIEAIQRIKKENNSRFPMIGIKTTITDKNWPNLMKLHNEMASMGAVDHHSLNLLKQNPVRGGNKLYADDSDKAIFKSGNTAKHETAGELIAEQVEILLERSKETGIPVSFKPNISTKQLANYFNDPSSFGVKSCQKMTGVLTMYYDGSLAPCDIGIDLGNIRDFDYNSRLVWKTQKFNSYRKKIQKSFPYPEECAGCCLATHSAKPLTH